MARPASTLLVLGLLVATAAAFAVTERLKLQLSPIYGTEVSSKVVSPTARDVEIAFRLREADTVAVHIVDRDGDVVRTLVEGERVAARRPFAVTWDGERANGDPAEEATYRPRVHLDAARRTIVLPNPIRVDATEPTVAFEDARPRVFSPDRDGRSDKVNSTYSVDEPAKVYVHVNGRQAVEGRGYREQGKLEWYGTIRGRSLPPRGYTLTLVAEDAAGNRSTSEPRLVTLRYITLARDVVRVAAGARFSIRVSTDAARYRWRFAGGSRTTATRVLTLRAPATAGRYTLFVALDGRSDSARVIVEPPRGG